MTYTPTQLEVILVFGKKELTEGCIVRKEKGKWFKIANISDIKYPDGKTYYKQAKGYGVHGKFYQPKFKTESDFEILGHEVHLEDVFRLARDRKMFYGIKGEYVKEKEFEYIEYLWFSNMDIGEKYIPYNPTIPLLEQPESVLIQLLNLFK